MPVGGSASEPGLLTREFLTLCASTMAYFLAMGAANPVLPRFVDDGLGGTEAQVGLVFGSIAVSALLLRPVFGRLGDRKGARLLIIVGALIGAGGHLLFTVVSSVPAAAAARLPIGAAQAALMTGATTLAIDLAPEDRRGEAASFILVAFHIGLGLGPLIGESVLNAASFDVVWLVLSALCVVSAGIALFLPRHAIEAGFVPGPLLHPRGVTPGIVILLGMVAFVGVSSFLPLYGREIHVERVGPVFMVSSITIALIRIFARRVPDRMGPIRSSTIALGTIGAGCVVLATWAGIGGLYVGVIVLAGGTSLLMPALVPAALDGVPPHRRASAMATFTMFIDVAVALTGPTLGLLISGAGYRVAFLASGGLALAAVVVLHLVLAPQWYERRTAAA